MPKTILFTQTKDVACKIAHTLQLSAAKNYVGVYHASLTQHTKRAIQDAFSSAGSSLRCLVATVAFGMVCRIVTNLRIDHDCVSVNLIIINISGDRYIRCGGGGCVRHSKDSHSTLPGLNVLLEHDLICWLLIFLKL